MSRVVLAGALVLALGCGGLLGGAVGRCEGVLSRAEVEALLGRPLLDSEIFAYDGRNTCTIEYRDGERLIAVVDVSWIADTPADAIRWDRPYYDDHYGKPEELDGVGVRALLYRAAVDPEAERRAQECFAQLEGGLKKVAEELDADPLRAPDLGGLPTMDQCLALSPAKGAVVLIERERDLVKVRVEQEDPWLEAVLRKQRR